ncbi:MULTISPECIES: MFS transporter [Pseudonocardia]|uniref:MFS transporter n=2 Tax=Pseudonocardiaceae TaxID=2070 RepID=UPI00091D8672|nr:Inner membrane transport protein YdhP [Pseudonocardia autotrophica]
MLLVVLACAVFAQTTSEFMLAGLVPDIAADLGVTPLAAGSLTAAFAVGMVVGAPLVALAARRLSPRLALRGFLAAFVAVHVAGALAPGLGVLLVTRVLAALCTAGFLAVALSVAVAAVPPQRTARATATLLSGTTLALIAGVPAGALVGQAFGWRATFWSVAAVAAVALVGVVVGVPAGDGGRAPAPGLRAELTVLRRGPVVRTLALCALVNSSTFAAHTYLAPLLATAGGPPVVPAGLLLFGVGAVAGVGVAGRFADTRTRPLLLVAGGALPVGWAALALGSGHPAAVLALVGLVGALGFAVGSTLVVRALTLAREAPTVGGAVATASLNAGATVGPLLGGAGLAVAGPTGPVWTAAALALVASPMLASVARPAGVPDPVITSDERPSGR